MKHLLLPLVLSVALCGCASSRMAAGPKLPDETATLAPGMTCTIPAPGAGLKDASVAQSIVVHVRGQTYTFQAQIQITADEVDLVALDNLGRRGMTAKWRGGHLAVTREPWLPAFVRPADILTDIAVVFWPVGTVAPQLSACGANLTEVAGGRSVATKGAVLMSVAYEAGSGWNRTAHLHNGAFGFDIDIQSAEIAQ